MIPDGPRQGASEDGAAPVEACAGHGTVAPRRRREALGLLAAGRKLGLEQGIRSVLALGALAAALPLGACGSCRKDEAPSPGPAPQAERWLGVFASAPGARQLCRQHVSGAGPGAAHILWSLYATPLPPGEVRAFYARHPGLEQAPAPAVVQLRIGDKVLTAYPASSPAYPRCGVEPGPAHRTAVVVSHSVAGRP
jgi:hypothetical protein